MTLSRTNRPLTLTGCVVTAEVLPRTCTTGVNEVPLAETSRSKSRVLRSAPSLPAWAWRTTIDVMVTTEPRSTCRKSGAALEHHLSPLPPETLPLTAFAGPSVEAHGAEPVAGRFNARLPPGGGGGGGGGGGAPPWVYVKCCES